MEGAALRALGAAVWGVATALTGWILITLVGLVGRVAVVERASQESWEMASRLTRVEAKIDFLVEQVAEVKRGTK